MTADELPEGWEFRPVGTMFKLCGGGTPYMGEPRNWGGSIPWLSSGDIKTDRITGASKCITQEGLDSSSAKLCQAGTVILVVRSGILKHTLPVAVLDIPAAINQDIRALDSGNREVNEWLALAFRAFSPAILEQNREGTTVQSVKTETIQNFSLPLPPLAEQRRIVAAVERILGKVSTARARLERVPTTLKRFRQAVLAAACSGRLTADWRSSAIGGGELPNGWETRRLDSIFKVQTGGTPDRKKAEYFENGTISWVRTTEVQNCDICETALKLTPLGLENSSAKVFPPSTLLIALYGEGKTRGQIGRLKISAATNQACSALVNPDLPEATNQYVFYCVLADYQRLRGESAGGNQPNLSNGVIKAWEIPLPPLAEQQEIVRRVSALFARADAIEARALAALKRVDALAQAVLAKAFRGELVPTEAELARRENRPYESAGELLERIRASATTPAKPSRTRKPKASPAL